MFALTTISRPETAHNSLQRKSLSLSMAIPSSSAPQLTAKAPNIIGLEGVGFSQTEFLAALDTLERALLAYHAASRRVAHAREGLEEALSELYVEKAVEGSTLAEREACLLFLTAAERFELAEAEHAQAEGFLGLQRAQVAVWRLQGQP
jgi:hypothetical protein